MKDLKPEVQAFLDRVSNFIDTEIKQQGLDVKFVKDKLVYNDKKVSSFDFYLNKVLPVKTFSDICN